MARATSSYRAAPHSRRLAAFHLIDLPILLLLVLLDVIWISLASAVTGFDVRESSNWFEAWFIPLVILTHAAYYSLTWGLAGASLGQWVFGLRLVGLDGRVPGVSRALIRYLTMVLLSPLWISWWPAVFRQDRRGVHDVVAGTQPIWERRRGILFNLQNLDQMYHLPPSNLLESERNSDRPGT